MKIEIKEKALPPLRNPILICGLPGSGYVAKLAVDHLISELKAELFAEIYCSSFPPQVAVSPEGSLKLLRHEIYHGKSVDGGRDIIIYTGDAQPIIPDAEYEIAEKVLEIGQKLGAGTLYATAAYITGSPVEKPRVFGTATDPELVEELGKEGVVIMNGGMITGMNGLLVGLAKVKDMKGVCLLGETSGYIIDPRAAQAVLEVLCRLLGIQVDMSNLEERAKETESILKTLEEVRHGLQPRPMERPQPERRQSYIS